MKFSGISICYVNDFAWTLQGVLLNIVSRDITLPAPDLTEKTGSGRKHLLTALKLLVVIGALGWLVGSGKLQWQQFVFAPGKWYLLVVSGVMFTGTMLVSFVRYKLLLDAVGIHLRLADVVRIGFIGCFFNTIMPGSLGGDVIKMAYVIRESGKRAEAVASVMMDRVLGLLGLISIGGVALCFSWGEVVENPDLHVLSLAIFGVLGMAGMCGLVSLVALGRNRTWGGGVWAFLVASASVFAFFALRDNELLFWGASGSPALLRGRALMVLGVICLAGLGCVMVVPSCQPGRSLANFVEGRMPLGKMIMRLVQSLLIYRNGFRIILASYALSVFLQGIGLLVVFVLSRALDLEPHPDLIHILYATPPAQVANALPISLGGLGVGEAAFDSLLRLASSGAVTGGAAIFLLLRLCITFLSLIGLPFYLLGKNEIDEVRAACHDEDESLAGKQ